MTKYIGPKTDGENVATQADKLSLSSETPDALTPDQSGAAGTATTAARSDHQHQILAATAGTILPDDVAAEGSASSFARSDHTHSITTATAGTISGTATEGSANSFARSDHNHALGSNVVGTSQISDGAVTAAKLAAGAGGGMTLLDSETFTSSTTYTMPAGAQIVVIECIGAGGGGGGGARNTSTSSAGGGSGGGGGGYYLRTYAAGQFAGTVTVTVPAGGTGGAGRTGSTGNGTRGNNGGMARFDWLYFFPGTFGNPGDSSGNNGTAGQSQGSELTPRLSTVGTNGLGTGGRVGTANGYKNIYGGGGGGGGSGAAATAGFAVSGGESVQNADFSNALTSFTLNNNFGATTGGGGAAGINAGDAGSNGTNRAGGGGGRANTAGAGGNGGNGATPGGGGGGGGGANGGNNGGTGGTGGDGQIAIWVYG